MNIKNFFKPNLFKFIFTIVSLAPVFYLADKEGYLELFWIIIIFLPSLIGLYLFSCFFNYSIPINDNLKNTRKKVYKLIFALVVLLTLTVLSLLPFDQPTLEKLNIPRDYWHEFLIYGLLVYLAITTAVFIFFLYVFLSFIEKWFIQLIKCLVSYLMYIGYLYFLLCLVRTGDDIGMAGLLIIATWILIGIVSLIQTIITILVQSVRQKSIVKNEIYSNLQE